MCAEHVFRIDRQGASAGDIAGCVPVSPSRLSRDPTITRREKNDLDQPSFEHAGDSFGQQRRDVWVDRVRFAEGFEGSFVFPPRLAPSGSPYSSRTSVSASLRTMSSRVMIPTGRRSASTTGRRFTRSFTIVFAAFANGQSGSAVTTFLDIR